MAEVTGLVWCYDESGDKKRRTAMETGVIVALALAIPIILFPAAFVWYLNLGGVFAAAREAKAHKAASKVAAK